MKKYFRFFRSESGKVDVALPLLLGVAFLMVSIGSGFIGGMITGFSNAYAAATSADPNGTIFTNLTTVIGVGPTLLVLGFVVAIAVVGFLGIKLATGKGN